METRPLLWGAFIIFLWSNTHGSSVIGYVIFGPLYLEWVIKSLLQKSASKKDWGRVLSLGLLTLIAGFLNHDLSNSLFLHFRFVVNEDWGKYIGDFLPLVFTDLPVTLKIYSGLILFTTVYDLWNKKIAEPLIVIFLGYETYKSQVLVPYFVLVTLPFMIFSINDFLQEFKSIKIPLTVTALALGVFVTFNFMKENVITSKNTIAPRIITTLPVDDSVEFFKTRRLKGNVLNVSEQGGPLLFYLSPEIKVFIDGRLNILYPYSFLSEYLGTMSEVAKLKNEDEKFHIDYVVAPISAMNFLLDTVIDSGEFSLEFAGQDSAVFSRAGKYKRTTPLLTHPECLDVVNKKELEDEYTEVQKTFPQSAPLKSFLALATNYIEARDKKFFLRQTKLDSSWIPLMRLAAYLSQENDLPEIASYYYSQIPRHSRNDGFRYSRLLCKFRNCEGAEKELMQLPVLGRGPEDFVQAYNLLNEISNKTVLKITSLENLNRMKLQLEGYLNGTKPLKIFNCTHH